MRLPVMMIAANIAVLGVGCHQSEGDGKGDGIKDGGLVVATRAPASGTATAPSPASQGWSPVPTEPRVPPDPPAPMATSATDAPKMEADLLKDPGYSAVWDARRQADLVVLLDALSEELVNQSGKDGNTSMSQELATSLQRIKLMDVAMSLGGYEARTGAFPADFVSKANAYLSSIASTPHKGTWTPTRTGTPAKDFSALAYVLRPDAPDYLREFIAARAGDGPNGWEDQETPYRPYLTRERWALERLALLGTLTSGEQERLGDLRASKWSGRYVEPVQLAELLSEYHDNEVRADSKFKAKVLSLAGIVGDVNTTAGKFSIRAKA
jgi:hypothetical protein